MVMVPTVMLTLLKPKSNTVRNDSHLRPVTHSPHIAFGVVLTVLSLSGSSGEDALLSRVGASHGPVTDTFATFD